MRILIDGQTLSTPDIRRGIGRVFLALCHELATCDVSKEWYLAVRDEADLAPLCADARRRLRPLQVPHPGYGGDCEARSAAYSAALGRTCQGEEIDLYWNPNPLMLNAVLPLELEGVTRVCTVHDVIPARLADLYRHRWSGDARRDYDRRLKRLPAWADHLVFVSSASREDYTDMDRQVEAKSSVILNGVDHATFWASAAAEPAAQPPYVLLVGGADPRKNVERAIEAFARLVDSDAARAGDLTLKIVCSCDEAEARVLRALAGGCGVGDRVWLRQQVGDAALSSLYRKASVLFFPSLYEGFGLPVVEGMASGVPLAVSDRPELRECAGPHAHYFDPTDVNQMAETLGRALRSGDAHRSGRCAMIRRAREFRWDESAAAYARLFDRLGCGASPPVPAPRLRLALASPWPPDRSGVAAYNAQLIEHLADRMDVEIFVERPDRADTSLGPTVRPLRDLAHRRDRYDGVLYHLGNSAEFHREIYRLAWESPGIAVLHDFNIHPFLQQAYLGTPEERLYRDALAEGYGERGSRHFRDVRSGRREPDLWSFPASRAIAARSEATIVHSAWVREQLAGVANLFAVPLGASPRRVLDEKEKGAARAQAGLPEDSFAIGVFGFLNAHKRIPSVLDACRRLRARGYPVWLLLVGEVNDGRLRLSELISEHGAEAFTHRTGYVDESSYWAYLDATDLLVNLRHPSMGESSGSLLRALGSGKPCLVSDDRQFAELPDSVCWKVSTAETEVDELAAGLAQLMRDRDLRAQLGRNAHRFVESYACFDRVTGLYEGVVRRAMRRRAR